MKIKSGPTTTPIGAQSPEPAPSATKTLKSSDPAAVAAAAKALGKDGQPIDPKGFNAASLPGVAVGYKAADETVAAEARFAIDKSVDARLFSLERQAKQEKSVPPSRAQVLLRMFPGFVRTHHAIAEGYDQNLQNKSPEVIGERQRFSRAVLAELGGALWGSVSLESAFRAAPKETAALLAATTPEAAQLVQAKVDTALKAQEVRQILDMIGGARERGFSISSVEGKVLVQADKQADVAPKEAYESILDVAKRAHAFLEKPPAQQEMSKAELAALRAEMKKPAAAKPTPEQLVEKALVHMKSLEGEIAGAPAPSQLERFKGAMIGLAIGDALGGPTEFMSREDIRSQYGLVTKMVGGGWLHLQPGEYTDDTQMAVAMAESIVKRGGFDANDLADNFVKWLNTDPKDVGNLTRSALEIRRIGVDAEAAGRIPWQMSGFENAGNGSVMRAAPVALLTALSSDAQIEALAAKSSAVSHYDPRCQLGTAAIAKAVALIMAGEPDVLGKVVAWLEPKNPELADAIAAVPHMEWEEVRTSGFVVHTVQAAFWALHHAKNYVDGIVKISNLGEDTDTAGATAGILLGAKFGLEGIPQSWRAELQNASKLEGLATKIHGLAQAEAGA